MDDIGHEMKTSPYRIGAPPWQATLPLRQALSEFRDVAVEEATVAELAGRFERNELDCVLLPVLDCLRFPACRAIPGIGLCVRPPSPIDRLLARVPPGEVRQVAMDPRWGGMQALARLVLGEVFHVNPEVVYFRSDAFNLDELDAIALAGDAALVFPHPETVGYDLAALWNDLTRLPLVKMLFLVSRQGRPAEMRRVLAMAEQTALAKKEVLCNVSEGTGGQGVAPPCLSAEVAAQVARCTYYRLGSDEMRSVRLFLELAARHNLCTDNAEIVFC